MQIVNKFVVGRPLEDVWAFLGDIPVVASCIPGLELLDEIEPGVFKGRFSVKVGLIKANLDGEGRLHRDEASRTGSIEGKGVDRRGGSQVRATLEYKVVQAENGTAIDVTADMILSGPLAQVGRTGIIEDVAQQLTNEFAAELEKRLSETQPPGVSSDAGQTPSAPTSRGESAQAFDAGSAIWTSLWRRTVAWLRRLFGLDK